MWDQSAKQLLLLFWQRPAMEPHITYWQMKVFAAADRAMPLKVNKQPVCRGFADVQVSVIWRARWLYASTDVAKCCSVILTMT